MSPRYQTLFEEDSDEEFQFVQFAEVAERYEWARVSGAWGRSGCLRGAREGEFSLAQRLGWGYEGS